MVWTYFKELILQNLTKNDDPYFWEAVITTIIGENDSHCESYSGKDALMTKIGACSHWIRPHQSRFTTAGGFAAPFGYGNEGNGYSFSSLPEFDWSETWIYKKQRIWVPQKGRPSRRPLFLRICMPTRTKKHDQAAVHTRWEPGSPVDTKKKIEQLFFFRKFDEEWKVVSDLSKERN